MVRETGGGKTSGSRGREGGRSGNEKERMEKGSDGGRGQGKEP